MRLLVCDASGALCSDVSRCSPSLVICSQFKRCSQKLAPTRLGAYLQVLLAEGDSAASAAAAISLMQLALDGLLLARREADQSCCGIVTAVFDLCTNRPSCAGVTAQLQALLPGPFAQPLPAAILASPPAPQAAGRAGQAEQPLLASEAKQQAAASLAPRQAHAVQDVLGPATPAISMQLPTTLQLAPSLLSSAASAAPVQPGALQPQAAAAAHEAPALAPVPQQPASEPRSAEPAQLICQRIHAKDLKLGSLLSSDCFSKSYTAEWLGAAVVATELEEVLTNSGSDGELDSECEELCEEDLKRLRAHYPERSRKHAEQLATQVRLSSVEADRTALALACGYDAC